MAFVAVVAVGLVAALGMAADNLSGRAGVPAVLRGTKVQLAAFGRSPLAFVPNRGQSRPGVRLVAQGAGFAAGLTDRGVLLTADERRSQGSVSIGFIGASAGVHPVAAGYLRGRVSYLIGGDPRRWETNLPMFSQAVYQQVWPGIDASFSGSQRRLEYTFDVSPGADPSRIRLGFAGGLGVRLARDGSLVLAGGLRQLAPRAYQVIDGTEVPVASRYELRGDHVAIRVGSYDRRLALLIDPTVALAFSTYLGGNQGDQATGIALDPEGNAYIGGNTQSTDFATSGSEQPAFGGGDQDGFVAKLSADGQTLDYVTYIGGSNSDFVDGIAVDSAGEAYFSGATFSKDFPTVDPLPGQAALGSDTEGGFVAKLNSTGTALVFSTLLAGNNFTECVAVAVDSAGSVYVTGDTSATNFPTTAGAAGTTEEGALDAFVTKLSSAGGLDYSTYLGGNGGTEGTAIAVDSAGAAWLTGGTNSTDLATPGAPQSSNPDAVEQAFVLHLAAGGNTVLYATYLGGSSFSSGNGIALDPPGNVYVAGVTDATDFPTTPGAFQTAFGGGDRDAFVTKYSALGAVVYSTYLGGSDDDEALGVAVDSAGSAYLTGDTQPVETEDVDPGLVPDAAAAGGFPVANAFQDASAGGEDAFVTELSPDGSALVYSTYLGGSDDDGGAGIAVDSAGSAYVAGFTNSSDFPTVNAEQPTADNGDGFVAKILTVDFPLTVNLSGTGTGTVTSVPAGIACGSTCAQSFAAWTPVTLTAAAAAGSAFAGWAGAECAGTGACTVTMNAAQNVTATFNAVSPAVGVTTTAPLNTSAPVKVPVNTSAPVISGQPEPTRTLTCSPGAWTNDPSAYSYQWYRAGVAISGATGSRYVVQIADEASGPSDTIVCEVTARNAAGTGTASSRGVLVASGSTKCPLPTGSLNGSSIGVLKIGMPKAIARKRLKRFAVTKNRFDNFCLFAGWGIRAAYPSAELVDSVDPSQRAWLQDRIVIALTANPFYAFKGLRPGATESSGAKRLHLGKPLHIGSNYWYIVPATPANGVLKVRGGIIQEVGLVTRVLTTNRAEQKRLLGSFPDG